MINIKKKKCMIVKASGFQFIQIAGSLSLSIYIRTNSTYLFFYIGVYNRSLIYTSSGVEHLYSLLAEVKQKKRCN